MTTYLRIRFGILAALCVAALAVIVGPARSQSQQDYMKVCADEWNALKSANKTGGRIYQDFVKECLAKYLPPGKPAAAGSVNLNTASAPELDALPQVGKVHAKAIIEARTKAKFKNWDDFVARKIVPANVQDAIRMLVEF